MNHIFNKAHKDLTIRLKIDNVAFQIFFTLNISTALVVQRYFFQKSLSKAHPFNNFCMIIQF